MTDTRTDDLLLLIHLPPLLFPSSSIENFPETHSSNETLSRQNHLDVILLDGARSRVDVARMLFGVELVGDEAGPPGIAALKAPNHVADHPQRLRRHARDHGGRSALDFANAETIVDRRGNFRRDLWKWEVEQMNK